MEFPYIDVANAILAMSRPKPIERSPYHVMWSNDSCCDGYGCESFESAKRSAMNLFLNWMYDFTFDEQCPPELNEWSEDQRDNWDYIIEEYEVWITKYNPDTDEYDDYWCPSDEDLREILWLPYDKLVEAYKM